MKKSIFILSALLVITSCSVTKETKSSRSELREQKKIAEEAVVKKAVESGRYIIKLDRLFLNGGVVDLIPRANYIIIDGKRAIINAAYIGRQMDIRPIAGINVRGIATNYELTPKTSKGLYSISMKVENKASSFDLYLTIGNDGTCNASVSSLKIDIARYRGYLVPLESKTDTTPKSDLEI